MKKVFAIMGILAAVTVTVAQADPGPYDAYLTADSCDANGADGIATPCTTPLETNVIDAVNYLLTNAGVASPFTSNTDLDAVQLTTNHSYWGNSGGQAVLAYISISAGGFNTPFIYEEGNVGSQVLMTGQTGDVLLGDGSFADPYPGLINPFIGNFGVGINHTGSVPGTKYSDPTLNPDGYDQMLAFDLNQYLSGKSIWLDLNNDGTADQEIILSDVYLLAFEDKTLPVSNHDFNDSIFLFARVTPSSTVPEPMTMALFGTGLVGMAIRRRKTA